MSYSIPKSKKLFAKVDAALKPYRGKILSGDVFDFVKYAVLDVIGNREDYRLDVPVDDPFSENAVEEVAALKEKRLKAIDATFSEFIGETISQDRIREMCTLVTGWIDELKDGIPFQKWEGIEEVQGCVYVEDISRVPCKGRLYRITLRGMSGRLSNMRLILSMTGTSIQEHIRNLGYQKYDQHSDYEISGLMFDVTIRIKDKRPHIVETRMSNSQKVLNKRIRDGRKKVCKGPFKAYHGKRECAPCPIGRDHCSLSRFKKSYEITGECVNGHKGFFRTEEDKHCLACTIVGKFDLRRKVEKRNNKNPKSASK